MNNTGARIDFGQFSVRTEIPAVLVGDSVQPLNPKLAKLSSEQLEAHADALDGVLVWVKVRSTISPLEETYCCHKKCPKLAAPWGFFCAVHDSKSNPEMEEAKKTVRKEFKILPGDQGYEDKVMEIYAQIGGLEADNAASNGHAPVGSAKAGKNK